MIKRYAAHWVVAPRQEKLRQSVVEIVDGSVTRITPLEDEPPFTEWIGGVIVVAAVLPPCTLPMTLTQLTTAVQQSVATAPFSAWHITTEQMSEGLVRTPIKL